MREVKRRKRRAIPASTRTSSSTVCYRTVRSSDASGDERGGHGRVCATPRSILSAIEMVPAPTPTRRLPTSPPPADDLPSAAMPDAAADANCLESTTTTIPGRGPQQKNDGLKANVPLLGSKAHYNRTTNYQAYFPLASRRRGSVKRQPSPSPPRPTMVESTSALEPPPPSPPRPTTSLTWSQRRECSGRGLNERIMGSN